MLLIRTGLQSAFEIVISAALYLLLFYFNQAITEPLEEARGINWIFLPAGARIFITLIFNYSGAIGLILASLIINYFGFYEYDATAIWGIAIICGAAPLLGRHFVIHNLKVLPDLSNISYKQILGSIVAYSALSSGMHQLWFATRGLESSGWNHFLVMLFGDIVGSILFVALVKYAIILTKNISRNGGLIR